MGKYTRLKYACIVAGIILYIAFTFIGFSESKTSSPESVLPNRNFVNSKTHLHYACSEESRLAYEKLFQKARLFNFFQKPNKSFNSPRNLGSKCNCFEFTEKLTKTDKIICLPTYFIIGTAKAGSSSLFQYLLTHENFIAPLTKEYFHTLNPIPDWIHIKDITFRRHRHRLRRYINQFSHTGYLICYELNQSSRCKMNLTSRKDLSLSTPQHIYDDLVNADSNPTLIKHFDKLTLDKNGHGVDGTLFMTGDGTPDYHFYAEIPEGMKAFFPTAKLILTVRNALERSISAYKYVKLGGDIDTESVNLTHFLLVAKKHKEELQQCQNGKRRSGTTQNWRLHLGNPLDLGHELHTADQETFKNYLNLRERVNNISDPCHFQPFINNANNFFARSQLVSHLKWWIQHFNPEQILLIDFQKLVENPNNVLREVIKFLGHDHQDADGNILNLNFKGPLNIDEIKKRDDFFTKMRNFWRRITGEKGMKSQWFSGFNASTYNSDTLAEIKELFEVESMNYTNQIDIIRKTLGIQCIV